MESRTFDRDQVMGMIHEEWSPLRESIRWECIRCGKCCKTSWRVNLTWIELGRLVDDERIDKLPEFRKEVDPSTGLDHPYFVIGESCPILKNGNVCTAYPRWPYTCATYPFLLMPDGELMYHPWCSGIGSGPTLQVESIKELILRERKRAGMIV